MQTNNTAAVHSDINPSCFEDLPIEDEGTLALDPEFEAWVTARVDEAREHQDATAVLIAAL